MKKSEMIEALATKTGLTKTECEKVFNATFDLFKDELAKGEKIKIAASKSVSFKAGSELKKSVN